MTPCTTCGREAAMTYHGECAACFIDSYDDGTGFYCPLWGSEECDWECPNGGLG